ncbi:keratin, type I cytoskeletal 18 [Anolis carolinensis]|uniref:IF rod domain-containing protein n=1 Tax=Anolis carolinensis TaxID=28377 RepID=H9GI59_ANOCA|nr:PREDICTED: keratin, type I cytoskeletal 18 [Anolis carolinensis]|eukprot:XP_003224490.1 PREDICTED: keratin, type I cytoskeletal 18 [Anolis carolinensis]
MSFSRSSTVYTSSSSSRPGGVSSASVQLSQGPSSASVYGGAGGSGSRISVSRVRRLGSSQSFGSGGGFGGGSGYGGYSGSFSLSGSGVVHNEKETMQDLNDRLASYLEKVRSLEADNRKLEIQIREHLDKKGPSARDWSHYFELIEDLRNQIFDQTIDNSRIVLQIDNARLAADDFRVKFEAELAIRQSVENDINGLRRVIDDTNMMRLQLESEIEALKEELVFMKKNHQDEVNNLQAQIANSGLTVEVDAPKTQDLGKIMAEIRAQYDVLAQKNLEDLDKYWSQQITESTVVITEHSKDIEKARANITDLRRSVQTHEIELESARNLRASLEANLHEVEMRYGLQMEHLNGIILRTEADLAQLRNDVQRQAEEYQILLNIKDKLEAEITTYRHLLEGGEELSLKDALLESTMQTTQKIHSTKIVDGKVVSETSETRVTKK